MKKHIKTAAIVLLVAAIFAFFFWWGGDAPSLHGFPKEEKLPPQPSSVTVEEMEASSTPPPVSEEKKAEAEVKKPAAPIPIKEEVSLASEEKKANTCQLSVTCDTILKNKEYIDPSVYEIIPKDGVILARSEVVLCEGDSVFDVLLRETKNRGIHLEFVKTPGLESTYVEGMANIYEFDCGELSGWMFKVNGSFPKVSCAEYVVSAGDCIEWVYTCNSGEDVGGKREF